MTLGLEILWLAGYLKIIVIFRFPILVFYIVNDHLIGDIAAGGAVKPSAPKMSAVVPFPQVFKFLQQFSAGPALDILQQFANRQVWRYLYLPSESLDRGLWRQCGGFLREEPESLSGDSGGGKNVFRSYFICNHLNTACLDLKGQPEGWGTNPSYGSLEIYSLRFAPVAKFMEII